MNKAFSTNTLSSRKEQLQSQIFDALQLKQPELLSFLEIKWVHRYGFSTLPRINNKDTIPNISTSSKELPSIDEEALFCEMKDSSRIEGNLEDRFIEENIFIDFDQPKDCSNEHVKEEEPDVKNYKEQETQPDTSTPFLSVPPPPPSLKHLRRWLPLADEDLPKAS